MKIDYDAFRGKLEPIRREPIPSRLHKKMRRFFQQAAVPVMVRSPLPEPIAEIREFLTSVVGIQTDEQLREWIRGHPLFQEIKDAEHSKLRGDDGRKQPPKQGRKRNKRRGKNKR
ncbi:hypothetical protein AAFO90_24270 [Phaeobacter sp. CAU 1743]|uniref:hypothetical protein n=1 Tax=Phaeobacter sp. CAU 1743 TaxID=3140367 RepID=UPI00325BDE7A